MAKCLNARYLGRVRGIRARRVPAVGFASRKTGRRVCAVAVAALLAAPAVSHAGNFWYGPLDPQSTGWGNQVIVQSVYAYAEASNKKISVGLYNYASFTTQWYYACHPYAQQQYDWPGVYNPHTVQQNPVQAYTQVTNVC